MASSANHRPEIGVVQKVVFYLTFRSIWRLYFNPLSKYPGPEAGGYLGSLPSRLSGRWPWAVEDVLKKYGDVVRFAPNELGFVTPQSLNAKQLSPAFSGRALKAKEPTLHKYVDLFVERMKALGGGAQGVSLPTWINWMAVDISADMAYNREMTALKDMKEPPYLSLLAGFSKVIIYIFLAFTGMRPHSHIRDHSRQQLERRSRCKGEVGHFDFFEQIIPEDREPPKDKKEMRHLEQIVGQLLVAGYEPSALWLYFSTYYFLKQPRTQCILAKEIRDAFNCYNDITPSAAAQLSYLNAFLKESLRVMPVVSPGAVVDETFIPKGVVCQSSPFALARSPRNFRDPLSFRPERWLPEDHPLYDSQFADDNRKGFHPFSQGPRICAGREIAWWQSRLFIAKVLWIFNMKMVGGQNIEIDRDLRGWGMYLKPEVRVQFAPVAHNHAIM
ncbi:cytochrome P450 [Camillea tinctor]|nr:cytochrome P450 [Camillea tinctor]